MSAMDPIVCGYELHLYCQCETCNTSYSGYRQYHGGMAQFAHPKKAGAFREARQAGWKVSENNNTAIAPGHPRKEISP